MFTYNNFTYQFKRYPQTSNRSLRPWSAADEYILQYLEEIGIKSSQLAIYHDRFGFLSTLLHSYRPYTIISYASQEKAIRQNQLANKLTFHLEHWLAPLDELPASIDIGLIRIPKSVDLFRLYLHMLCSKLNDNGMVICSFMTRHFSPQLLSVAEEYFEHVEQSKARKKARLLILKTKKELPEDRLIHDVPTNNNEALKQYYGVFSANHIDYATRFLQDNLELKEDENTVLDLASGNGVLAKIILDNKPETEIHLLDDSFLAIESSKLNIESNKAFFHYNDSLELFQPRFFDLIVSNPPFHFEHETNIEVSLQLFKEAGTCLKEGGRFVLVANKHLNYKTHLGKLFSDVQIVNENEKFIIYQCIR